VIAPVQRSAPGGAANARTVQVVALVWARLVFGAIAFVTFLGLFAAWSSFAEITTHFRAVYAWAALAAVLLAVGAREWRLSALCTALLVWQLGAILPWYAGRVTHAEAGGESIKVLSANVHANNPDQKPLLDLVARENPDVVFIQELSPAWAEALTTLQRQYPYSVESARKDYFGMALLSRYPLRNVLSDDPVDRDIPMIRADVEVNGRLVHVVNAHLSSPESPSALEARYRQFPWLTEYVATVDRPLIVAGDLNCTMWSPLYKRLVRAGRLASVREGRGIMPTWFWLGGSMFMLPLDHVLVSGAQIASAGPGDRIGSDHRPLVAEILIPTQ
jgi:endonuclease/exonuclease/phosphatase (EEP) superfamily protein YafD